MAKQTSERLNVIFIIIIINEEGEVELLQLGGGGGIDLKEYPK